MILDLLRFLITYLSVYYIFWELYILLSDHMIELFIAKEKKTGYSRFELISQYSYTIWMILGILALDWLLFTILFVLAFVVEMLLNTNKIHHYIKIWILRFDSAISIIILYFIFRNYVHLV